VVQRRVKPQPADPRHLISLAGAGRVHRREAAVKHQDQLPLGEPAPDLEHHLPRPVDGGLVRDSDAAQRALAFDPLHLVDGIEATDDPLLEVRSAAYVTSRRRRK
jgi:hypothetical protein